MEDPIVIVSCARTPMGGLLGSLKDVAAPQLGATAIKAALERGHVKPESVDEVIMGCVLPAGLGQAPARQAAIAAGIPYSAGATTINKMCGSGMKAIMQGYDALLAHSAEVVVAGGFESMTNAPHLLPKSRMGFRLGHTSLQDHMFLDGLEDSYSKGKLMGYFADDTAAKYQFSREQQDEFAIRSLQRAQAAIQNGSFKNEIAPVTFSTRAGNVVVDTDEQPLNAKVDKIPQLKPAFNANGTVTAANSSSISDGAAALTLTRLSTARKLNLTPLAKILAHSTHSQEPAWFTTAPVGAIRKLLQTLQKSVDDIDLFEINEAFAVVTLAAIKDLELDPAKVNIHGGACALGHPVGASGARIVTTLLYALQKYGKKQGIAALCIGGGEATALAIELM